VRLHCRSGGGSCFSEVKIAVDAPEAAYGVVKIPVVRRAEVLLNVARIVVIGDIDDLETAEKLDAMAAVLEIEWVLQLYIETHKSGKAAGSVFLADIVPILVEFGVRETAVGVEHGNKLESVGQANKAPEQHAVVTENSVRAENAEVPSIREILVVSR
jgi:hypothetical protein